MWVPRGDDEVVAAGAHLLDERFGQSLGHPQLDAFGDERRQGGQDPDTQQLRGSGQVYRSGRGHGVLQPASASSGAAIRAASSWA